VYAEGVNTLTLLAFEWQAYVLGFLTALLFIAAVLAALGQIGTAFQWVRQQLRPTPPTRVKFKSHGGQLGSSTETGRRVWTDVQPDFSVRNDGPSALYEVEAGMIDPRGSGGRVKHPTRVQRLGGEGTRQRFGSSQRFRLPPEWLDGYEGLAPQKQVAYFVVATDEAGRRWEATCRADTDDWALLTFRRKRG
jgi:hypothetical protein